jgi:CheY-like chemotaxis protein
MTIAGTRVLLVEDEAIIAMTAEDMLQELECEVASVASTLEEALAAAEAGGFALALLDINLNGRDSFPVAARLKADGVPFVFTTGYGSGGRGAEFDDVPVVTKPYRVADLESAIRAVLARG